MSNTTFDYETEEVRRLVDMIARVGDDEYALGAFALVTTMLRPAELNDHAHIEGGALTVSASTTGAISVHARTVPATAAVRHMLDDEGGIGTALHHAGIRTLHELRIGLAGDGIPHLERIREWTVAAAVCAATTPQLKRAVFVYAGLVNVPVADADRQAVADFLDWCVTRAGYVLSADELAQAA